MLSRLPISLSQLNQGKSSKKTLKMKSNNYLILCTDQKILQKQFIKL